MVPGGHSEGNWAFGQSKGTWTIKALRHSSTWALGHLATRALGYARHFI